MVVKNMEKRPGILTKKEREKINRGIDNNKKAQMDRIKSAYDKTHKVIKDTQEKNKV